MRCPGCGHEGEGKFCTRCGTSLAGEGRACGACGAALEAGDRYCAECGEPVGGRPRKPFAARLPWILSAVALVVFSVGIALFVQRWTAPRPPGGLITGGIPGADDGTAAGSAGIEGAPSAAMPSAAEIAAMPPREAADRLFDRAMSEGETGDGERAVFFARMGLQAYARVPAAEMDDDARFHVGLLHLAGGDPGSARGSARELLERDPDHLFGLVLAARVAEATGEEAEATRYRERLRAAIAAGVSPREPPYAPHAALIEREAGVGR